MDTLLSLRVFRQVVERGSFVAAADQLALSPAMASKHVAHLEGSLGLRLLNRTSRHVSLTEAGAVYYAQCKDALEMLDTAEASLTGRGAEPKGTLKVTAPGWFANARFADVLAHYQRRFPKVVLDFRLSNWRVDLAEEGFDLALRASRTDVPHLIVRPICEVPFEFVATPDYLARHGPLDCLAQVGTHAAVLPAYIKAAEDALAVTRSGKPARLPIALKTDHSTFAYFSVMAGVGFGYLPLWLISEDLARGRLQKVLIDQRHAPVKVFAAYTSRKYLTPKVRSFIDFLTTAL